jgi:hypothetical protein
MPTSTASSVYSRSVPLGKEAASLDPDQVFLRSREDTEPLTPTPVFRSGRSRAEGLRICLPSVFLWQRITGKQIIPLDRQTRSVHGTEPDLAIYICGSQASTPSFFFKISRKNHSCFS